MTAITWDDVGSRVFETGVDRGVFYPVKGVGVAWNGLVSITEHTDTTTEPLYFDGQKYNDVITVGDLKARLSAYTYPDEFSEMEGVSSEGDGMFYHAQKPQRFHMTYRTMIGNDVAGNSLGYRLHLLYNLLPVPAERAYSSLSDEPNPLLFEWDITSVPVEVPFMLPTSHIFFDSRFVDPQFIETVETILYGDVTHEPVMPEIIFFANMLSEWTPALRQSYIDTANRWQA